MHARCRRVVAGLLMLGLLASLFAVPAWAQEGEGVTVRAKGLRIVAAGYGEDDRELRPFNWSKGTAAVLMVERPAGNLIAVDVDGSELTAFADDAGNSLLEGEGWGRKGFGHSANVSEDGRAAMIEISGPALPAPGAEAISARGVLKLVTAEGRRSVRGERTKLTKDGTLKVHGISFHIKDAKPSEWREDSYEVTLATSDDVSGVAELRFLRDGEPVASRRSMTSSMKFQDQTRTTWTYSFEGEIDAATPEVDVWVERATHEAPFDLEIGVGLGGD